MEFATLEVYLAPDDAFHERFIDFNAFPAEIRVLVYRLIFRRTNTFGLEPLRPLTGLLDGNDEKCFSTILRTSSQIYHEALPILYSENTFAIRAVKDCFKPFEHPLIGSRVPTICQLRDLTVHIVKLSRVKTIWKTLCGLNLNTLTLDIGHDGEPSVGSNRGTHDPMLAIAQVLHLTRTCPEDDLPQIIVRTKTVKRYRSGKFNGSEAYQAFARSESNTGTSGHCPKARKVVLRGGITDVQVIHMPHAATYHVPGWHLKAVQDEDDAEDKENGYVVNRFMWLKQWRIDLVKTQTRHPR